MNRRGLKPNDVQIYPHNPDWVKWYEQDKAELQDILGGYFDIDFEHVGSTAIPNLSAKPIIHILAGVEGDDNPKDVAQVLSAYDGFHVPMFSGLLTPGSVRVNKIEDGFQTAHISVLPKDSYWWERKILFRDYLIENPDIALAYEDLKLNTVSCTNNRLLYNMAKANFIENIVREANVRSLDH